MGWKSSKETPKQKRIEIDLDHPLVKFTQDKKNWWTIRDAVRGTQIFGGIGSGKSSGSGKTLAKAFLKNGFGGLVLCAKPDEKDNWVKMANAPGIDRGNDLIIFDKESGYEFNPIEYEATRKGEGGGEIFNLSNLLMEMYKMGNRLSGGSGSGESERYWENALRRCMNRTLLLLQMAGQEISIANMRKLLSQAPKKDEINDKNLGNLSSWGKENYCVQCLLDADKNTVKEDKEGNLDWDMIYNYFLKEFPFLPEQTRPSIEESFYGILEPFALGILRQIFARSLDEEVRPEVTFEEGKIVILDFPVKQFLQAGVMAQSIYKLLWQQAMERRKIEEELNPIPVFLWVDEAQLFLSDYDQIFQTTARSSRAATVFISQNISNYYSSIGGRDPRPKIDSLLGNLGTKIFHANNDAVTNEWAAKTIGKDFQNITSVNVGKHSSSGSAQQLHYLVEPRKFTTLLSGGFDENKKPQPVQGYVSIAGKEWADGKNYQLIPFRQNI